jgi:excisionase family DNA binding protein
MTNQQFDHSATDTGSRRRHRRTQCDHSDSAPETAFLRLDQAATYLGLTPNTLYIWRHRRRGPASFRMGGRVMYRRATLDEWIHSQEHADSRSNPEANPLGRTLKRVPVYAPRTTRARTGRRVDSQHKQPVD